MNPVDVQTAVRNGAGIASAVRNGLWKRGLLITTSFIIVGIGLAVSAQALCTPSPDQQQYCNPLGNVTDIVTLIKTFLDYLLKITIPLAGLGIILTGLNYVWAAASGNPSKTTAAKTRFTHILLGSILVVGALALADAIINFLTNLS